MRRATYQTLCQTIAASLVFFTYATSAQTTEAQPGAAANREYAAVFAHSANPCSADYATAPYVQCMSKELDFVEAHLDSFVNDIRSLTLSAAELASLNAGDKAWRAYRDAFCSVPLDRGRGTIRVPMSVDCRLKVDRDYMDQLSGFYLLSQFPK